MQPDQPTPSPERQNEPAPVLPAPKPARRNTKVTVAIVAVVVLVAVIAAFVWMVQAHETGTVRDIFIIFMVIVLLFIGVMLLALVYQIAALTRMLREEIKPLLQNVQETVNTARGTTIFVSERMVRPVIGAAGTAAGIARVFSLLGDLLRPRRGSR
jgi:Na+/H+-dicarboxylate symporter